MKKIKTLMFYKSFFIKNAIFFRFLNEIYDIFLGFLDYISFEESCVCKTFKMFSSLPVWALK